MEEMKGKLATKYDHGDDNVSFIRSMASFMMVGCIHDVSLNCQRRDARDLFFLHNQTSWSFWRRWSVVSKTVKHFFQILLSRRRSLGAGGRVKHQGHLKKTKKHKKKKQRKIVEIFLCAFAKTMRWLSYNKNTSMQNREKDEERF